MRRAERKRRRSLVVWLGTLLLVTLAFGAGYGVGTWGAEPLPSEQPPEEVTLAEPAEGEGAQGLRKEAILVDEVYYKLCDRVEKQIQAVPAEWVGLERQQVDAILTDKELLSFAADQVVLFSSDPGLCPELQKYRTLLVQDGHVALFYGKPDDLGPLIEVTDIPVESLLPPDQDRLRRGILVNGQEEALRFLEGLKDVQE